MRKARSRVLALVLALAMLAAFLPAAGASDPAVPSIKSVYLDPSGYLSITMNIDPATVRMSDFSNSLYFQSSDGSINGCYAYPAFYLVPREDGQGGTLTTLDINVHFYVDPKPIDVDYYVELRFRDEPPVKSNTATIKASDKPGIRLIHFYGPSVQAFLTDYPDSPPALEDFDISCIEVSPKSSKTHLPSNFSYTGNEYNNFISFRLPTAGRQEYDVLYLLSITYNGQTYKRYLFLPANPPVVEDYYVTAPTIVEGLPAYLKIKLFGQNLDTQRIICRFYSRDSDSPVS